MILFDFFTYFFIIQFFLFFCYIFVTFIEISDTILLEKRSVLLYSTTNIIISKYKHSDAFNYCLKVSYDAKNFVLFRYRQLYFARLKEFQNLNENEQFVLDEFKLTEDRLKPISKKYFLPNYYHLNYLFTVTKNVDYYNDLSMQTTQTKKLSHGQGDSF